jgi:hypothetical protein
MYVKTIKNLILQHAEFEAKNEKQIMNKTPST